MKNFFIKKIKDNICFFYDDDINHLKNVLRIKLNDKITCIFDGKKYLCRINSLNPLNALIIQENNDFCEFKNHEIKLYQAVIKPKHMEWILAKCTELGVSEIVPVVFSRSQTNNLINQSRMQNIVLSSAKQAGRNTLPCVKNAKKYMELIDDFMELDYLLVPYENENEQLFGQIINQLDFHSHQKIGILVGPEGGFSLQEIDIIKKMPNVKLVSLTKTILRSETASFYTLSILVNYLLKEGL